MAQNAEALAQLRLGVQKIEYLNPLKDGPVLDWQGAYGREPEKLTKLTRAAIFRAKFTAVERGVTKEVEDDILACHRLGLGLTQSSSLLEYLIGMHIQSYTAQTVFDTFARMPVDTASVARLQDCMERPTPAGGDPVHNVIRGEKLRLLPMLQKAFEGTGTESKLKPDEAVFLAVHADLTWEQMDALDLRYGRTSQDIEVAYSHCSRFLSMSPWQARTEGLNFWEDLPRLTHKNPWLGLVMFNAPGVARFRAHCAATQDALATTLGLMRYRYAKGEFPDTLEKLVSAGFITRLPMDPYSDESLIYRRTNDDFLLYSLAEDFDDDGGRHSDWGRGREGGDCIFWPVQTQITVGSHRE